MLFLAEGKIQQPVDAPDRTTVAAWLGPMVDSGFLLSGYLDHTGHRVLMVFSAPEESDVTRRLENLPIVQDGSVSFSVSRVTALRFT